MARLSDLRMEVSRTREILDGHEAKVEDSLLQAEFHKIDVEREAGRLARLQDEIGDIRAVLFRHGVLNTHDIPSRQTY
jgi:hypothetical protein